MLRQNSGRLWNQQHSRCRLHDRFAITLRYVSFSWTLLWNVPSPLSLASQSSSRESGASSTARRAQAAPSTPEVVFVRQALLAAHPSMLVRLETGAPRRHTRNRRPMAPRRIPLVLEDDFQDQEAHRWETDTERGSGSHLPNGDREPELEL